MLYLAQITYARGYGRVVVVDRHLEDRLRSHYSAVLEHMEAQLQMALQLQDDADRFCDS